MESGAESLARSGVVAGADSVATLAVVLAAGAGSRFAGDDHKLRAHLAGRPVAAHAIGTAVSASIGPVLVVTGAVDLDDIVAALDGADIGVIHNPDWADGQATSLRIAIGEARRRGAQAIVVGLADQPFVEPRAWCLVAASTAPIAVATYGGARRNPVRLDRSVWGLVPTAGDGGARSLVRMRPELVEEVPCPGSAADIDTLEDLRTWQNRSSTNSP